MKRNLTVQLDQSVIQKARNVAARRSISISRLVSESIEQAAQRDTTYQVAKIAALAHLSNGFHMGGVSLPPRDELHDR